MELRLPVGLRIADVIPTLAASVRRTFRPHLPIYALALALSLVVAALAFSGPVRLSPRPAIIFLQMLLLMTALGVAAAATAKLVRLVRTERPASPLRAMGAWLADGLLRGDRAGNTVHGVIALLPLMTIFMALKTAIPGYNPFAWDIAFADLDRALHFGRQPWEILQPLLGYPLVTFLLNINYNLWFVVLFAVLVWQVVARNATRLRMQFLLAFAFTWFLGGNLLATIFSSAGPCFYGLLGLGPDPYASLMAYLRGAAEQYPIWALPVQDTLWESYIRSGGYVAGISAMPSMHVATATLMAILGWRTSWRLGAALTLFAVLIGLGSVHLAWHYAVDAYAGAALAPLFWWMAGWVVRLNQPGHRTAPARPAEVVSSF